MFKIPKELTAVKQGDLQDKHTSRQALQDPTATILLGAELKTHSSDEGQVRHGVHSCSVELQDGTQYGGG